MIRVVDLGCLEPPCARESAAHFGVGGKRDSGRHSTTGFSEL